MATMPPAISPDSDQLIRTLIEALGLARSMDMTMVERLLEMSLIELGQHLAAQQKSPPRVDADLN